jgi:uncharacterized damage-inducible protein DinB
MLPMSQSSTILDIRRNLRQSRQETLQLLRHIDEEIADYRPQPDAWSIKEHVIHLIALEEAIIHFARRILRENFPVSPLCREAGFDQKTWNEREVAARAAYAWPEAIQALQQTHQDLLEFIGEISEESLKRVGAHPVWGDPVTLASILRIPYRHERGHREEIAVLARIERSTIVSETPTSSS